MGGLFHDGVNSLALVDMDALGSPLHAVLPDWPSWANYPHYRAPDESVSPDGRYLAFLADVTVDESDDLFVVDLMSASPSATRITSMTDGRDVGDVRWAPDSRKLMFSSEGPEAGRHQLHVVDLGGGVESHSVVTVHDASLSATLIREAAWTRDSRYVCFAADLVVDDSEQIFVSDVSTPVVEARALIPPDPTTFFYRVDAGRGFCAFTATLPSAAGPDVYVADVSIGSAGPVRLNATPATDGGRVPGISVSPAGGQITFLGGLGGGSQNVYYADLRSGVPTSDGAAIQLSPLATGPAGALRSRWSPDSARFAFSFEASPDAPEELYVADLRGPSPSSTRQHTLPPDEWLLSIEWSPDGRRIASGHGSSDRRDVVVYDVSAPGAPTVLQSSPHRDFKVVWRSPVELITVRWGEPLVTYFDVVRSSTGVRLDTPVSTLRSIQPVEVLRDGRIVAELTTPGDHGGVVLLDPAFPQTEALVHAPLTRPLFVARWVL